MTRTPVLLACVLGLGLCAPPARAALPPGGDQHLEDALRHLYNLDYQKSRDSFRRIIELDPESPFGYLFEAGAIWWHSSMEYGLFKDTPTLQGIFEQDVDVAIDKADDLQDSKDKAVRADGYFVEGMALGTRGQWNILKGHWLRAYSDGKKAMKNLKRCVKSDPEYYDAYLGLGVFDYQAAHFSGFLRFAGAILGLRGDEEKGLERMQLAMYKGRFTSRQAAEFLMSIFIADRKDYARGLPIVQTLRQAFPESPFFELTEAAVRYELGERAASIKIGRGLFDRMRKDPPALSRKLLSLACGLVGERCLSPDIVRDTEDWINHALEAKEPGPPGWRTTLHLFRGYAHDLEDRRQDAEEDYRTVLAEPDFLESRARARECLETPLTRDSLVAYLRVLSRGQAWTPSRADVPPGRR